MIYSNLNTDSSVPCRMNNFPQVRITTGVVIQVMTYYDALPRISQVLLFHKDLLCYLNPSVEYGFFLLLLLWCCLKLDVTYRFVLISL